MQTHKYSRVGAFVSCLFAATAIVACGAPSASDAESGSAVSGVDTAASGDADARAHAAANTQLGNATRLLAEGGWTIGPRAFDRVQESEAAAIGESGAWNRVRVGVTRASDTASRGTLILAWREGAEDVLALNATDDEARTALREAVAEARGAEASAEPELEASPEEGAESASGLESEAAAKACGKYQAVCTSNSQCCSGLACNLPFVGPVTKPTHRCGCAKSKSYEYVEKIGSSVACFSLPENPVAAAFWMRHKKGCGDALCATAKGCGVACPSIVTSTSLVIECGIYNGHC